MGVGIVTRLTILQALETQLKTITPANGYKTAIGNHCTYWDTYELDYNGPASITFRDVDTNYEWANTRQTNMVLVEIEAIAWAKQTTKLALGCQVLEDIYRAAVTENWSPELTAVRVQSDSKDIDAKGKQAVIVTLTVEIWYRA
jgi:hypothetical protein